MRTLIVDASRAVRGVIRRVLQRSSFRLAIEEAGDGAAALARCRATAFDIVFLDCSLPDLDGIATRERLLHLIPDAKIVMMSSEDDEVRAAIEGETFLRKPFYPADVDRALHRALDAPAVVPGPLPFLPPGEAFFLEDVLR
jgi:CheY-like chemotaxis protein